MLPPSTNGNHLGSTLLTQQISPQLRPSLGDAPIGKIIAALEQRGEVKSVGKQWKCLCPAHDDHNPSLQVGVGSGGKVLLHCFSHQCTPAEITRALGLSMRDLFNGHMPAKIDFKDRIEKIWDYKDEQGTLLFQTIRLWSIKGKEFSQRRPDPKKKGCWIYGLGDVRLVPYRLRELLAADPDAIIFIPEGEKKVDILYKHGLIATCNSGGAGNWRASFAEYFHGRKCVLLRDNDEKGTHHVNDVNKKLKDVAKWVKILDLPGLHPKGDVYDWFTMYGGTRENLLRLVESPPDKEPERPVIVIGPDEHRVNAQAEEALAKAEHIYHRAGVLVDVVQSDLLTETSKIINRQVGGSVARVLPKSLLSEQLSKCAVWIRRKSEYGRDADKPTHPPAHCVNVLRDRGRWSSIPRLTGIVNHPVLLTDGTILSRPGYDRCTGLFLTNNASAKLSVPDQPSREDVRQAVAILSDCICDFPFKTAGDRSVWFAGLLTPLARYCFDGPTPLIVFEANTPGTGKGKLMALIPLILTCAKPALQTFAEDRNELQKLITSIAMEGESLVFFDNLSGLVGTNRSWCNRAKSPCVTRHGAGATGNMQD